MKEVKGEVKKIRKGERPYGHGEVEDASGEVEHKLEHHLHGSDPKKKVEKDKDHQPGKDGQ